MKLEKWVKGVLEGVCERMCEGASVRECFKGVLVGVLEVVLGDRFKRVCGGCVEGV